MFEDSQISFKNFLVFFCPRTSRLLREPEPASTQNWQILLSKSSCSSQLIFLSLPFLWGLSLILSVLVTSSAFKHTSSVFPLPCNFYRYTPWNTGLLMYSILPGSGSLLPHFFLIFHPRFNLCSQFIVFYMPP